MKVSLKKKRLFNYSEKPGNGSAFFASSLIQVKVSRKIPKEYSIFDMNPSIKVRKFCVKA
jgi:hypothetical protein